MSSDQQQQQAPERTRRRWSAPTVECLETRPEISAYSGAGDPWNRPQR
ncbi:hypothetical protein [Dactylosporangium sp. NPDC005555]